MTSYVWPSTIGTPETLDFGLVQTTGVSSSLYGRNAQVYDFVNSRWTTRLSIAIRDGATGAELEAFLAKLRKTVNAVRLPNFDKREPSGTLKNSLGLRTTAEPGDRSITIFAESGTTLKTGDMVEVGGNLVAVASDVKCSTNSNTISIPLQNRIRKRSLGFSRASTATGYDALGNLTTYAADSPRAEYRFGKNLYTGSDVVVDTGVYGVNTATLKLGASNPAKIQAGAQISVSATLQHDSECASDGAQARLYLFFATQAGTWTASAYLGTVGTAKQRLSATTTVPALADNFYTVAVGLYHQNGLTNRIGRITAEDIQVEFGAPTAYEPGVRRLLEGAATNLALQSGNFPNAVWGVVQGALTAAGAAPEVQAASSGLFVPTTANSWHEIYQHRTAQAGDTITGSWFVKASGYQFVQLILIGTISMAYANFNILSGGVTAGTAGVGQIDALANGWFRVSLTTTALTGSSSCRVAIAVIPSGTHPRAGLWAGDGASGILVGGYQFEIGPLSSYIPTTTAPSTRAADVINTAVNLTDASTDFVLTSKGAVTYGRGGVMQAMELSFEEKP